MTKKSDKAGASSTAPTKTPKPKPAPAVDAPLTLSLREERGRLTGSLRFSREVSRQLHRLAKVEESEPQALIERAVRELVAIAADVDRQIEDAVERAVAEALEAQRARLSAGRAPRTQPQAEGNGAAGPADAPESAEALGPAGALPFVAPNFEATNL